MDYLYQDETRIIIGVLFDVYNGLGAGYREKYYEKCICIEAGKRNILYKRQKCSDIIYKKQKLGYNRLDILFFDKILVELKVGSKLIKKDFDQINEYLKTLNLQIGLLVLYAPSGVTIRRIANIQPRGSA